MKIPDHLQEKIGGAMIPLVVSEDGSSDPKKIESVFTCTIIHGTPDGVGGDNRIPPALDMGLFDGQGNLIKTVHYVAAKTVTEE